MDIKYVMDEICSLLNTYKGRDKVLRTLCYSARLVGGLTNDKDLARKLMFVSKHMSATRTTLRLFDDLPMLKVTLEYGLGKGEDSSLMASLGILNNMVDQVYLPIEKISWLADHQLISEVNNSKWSTATTICWAASVYLNLIKTLRDLAHLTKHIEKLQYQNQTNADIILEKLEAKKRFQMISCIRLSLDLIHSINTLPKGFLWSSKLDTWHIGLIGTLSSVIGIYQIFAKKYL